MQCMVFGLVRAQQSGKGQELDSVSIAITTCWLFCHTVQQAALKYTSRHTLWIGIPKPWRALVRSERKWGSLSFARRPTSRLLLNWSMFPHHTHSMFGSPLSRHVTRAVSIIGASHVPVQVLTHPFPDLLRKFVCKVLVWPTEYKYMITCGEDNRRLQQRGLQKCFFNPWFVGHNGPQSIMQQTAEFSKIN